MSSYALGPAAIGPNCAAPTAASPVSHDKISIVEVPLGEPREAAVINEPSGMFQDGQVCTPTAGNPLVPGDSDFICNPTDDETRPFASRGCHDIQVLADARLAACSALAEGQLWDISDPEEPRLMKRVDNPNVEFWHNASFTYDGRVVAFSDEAGGGVEPWCKPGDPDTIGANWFYPVQGDATAPLGHFKPTRTTTGSCTAHNGNFVPARGRYVYTQAWYSLGTSVSDVTNLATPREIAFFQAGDRSPEDEAKHLGGHLVLVLLPGVRLHERHQPRLRVALPERRGAAGGTAPGAREPADAGARALPAGRGDGSGAARAAPAHLPALPSP